MNKVANIGQNISQNSHKLILDLKLEVVSLFNRNAAYINAISNIYHCSNVSSFAETTKKAPAANQE